MFVWPCARLQTVFGSGMKALESLEFCIWMLSLFHPGVHFHVMPVKTKKFMHMLPIRGWTWQKWNLFEIARQVKKNYMFFCSPIIFHAARHHFKNCSTEHEWFEDYVWDSILYAGNSMHCQVWGENAHLVPVGLEKSLKGWGGGKSHLFFCFLCLVRQLYLGTNFSFSIGWALEAELAIYLPHFAYVMLRWGS